MMPQKPGMPVSYLSGIPTSSLLGLDDFIESIRQRSISLADWLTETVTDEMKRREGILYEDSTPHEPSRPHFPIDFPPGELAAVLESLHLGSYCVNCPAVSKFIDELLMLTVGQTALQLRDYQQLCDKLDSMRQDDAKS